MFWLLGNEYLRTWPQGEVPWQYVDMPKGQVLSRTAFNERAVSAARLILRQREAVLRAGPQGARTRLSDDQFARAWAGAQEECNCI